MKRNKDNDVNLKGTLFSVFTVGAIIVIMWFGAYALYLAR